MFPWAHSTQECEVFIRSQREQYGDSGALDPRGKKAGFVALFGEYKKVLQTLGSYQGLLELLLLSHLYGGEGSGAPEIGLLATRFVSNETVLFVRFSRGYCYVINDSRQEELFVQVFMGTTSEGAGEMPFLRRVSAAGFDALKGWARDVCIGAVAHDESPHNPNHWCSLLRPDDRDALFHQRVGG